MTEETLFDVKENTWPTTNNINEKKNYLTFYKTNQTILKEHLIEYISIN